jgi:hypothetical protein
MKRALIGSQETLTNLDEEEPRFMERCECFTTAAASGVVAGNFPSSQAAEEQTDATKSAA